MISYVWDYFNLIFTIIIFLLDITTTIFSCKILVGAKNLQPILIRDFRTKSIRVDKKVIKK